MATIDKHLADHLIARDGCYPGDPRAARIIEYINAAGVKAYAVEYECERGRYSPSEYVRSPRVLWDAKQKKSPAPKRGEV